MSLIKVQLPDGSEYLELILSPSQTLTEVQKELQKITEQRQTVFRVITNSDEQEKAIANFQNSHENYEIAQRNTTFFRLRKTDLDNFIEANKTTKITDDFQFSKINNAEKDILENYMFTSFGVKYSEKNGVKLFEPDQNRRQKISENLNVIQDSPNLKTYLVQHKNGQNVGVFSLLNISDLGEIQLHSVAAKSDLDNQYTQGNKMSILMGQLADILQKKDFKYLSFSCSRPPVAQMYRDLHFEVDENRKCFVLGSK